jgi:5-methylcytosine-specific restriction enzyme subunit McrC
LASPRLSRWRRETRRRALTSDSQAGAETRQLKEFETVEIAASEVLFDGKLDFYPAVRKKGYFIVRVGASGLTLQAQGFVGVIPVNDRLTLEVLPRVPLGNLSRILDVSRAAPIALTHALRLYQTEGRMYPSLASVYAKGLRDAVETIVDTGLLKEYVRVEEETSFPRGRIDMKGTAQRLASRGIRHRVGVTHWQRTVDQPVNRCLLYAAWRLHQYAGEVADAISPRHRRQLHLDLNYVYLQFQGVHLDRSERFLSDDLVTGRRPLPSLRRYYRPALDLALAVIGRKAILLEEAGTQLQLPSLIVNMSTAFEAYIRAALVARSSALDGIEVVDGNLAPPTGGRGRVFHSGAHVVATPDIVYRHRRLRTIPLLLEVKYKPADAQLNRDDLNQAITYAFAYRTPNIVIVQPRAEASLLPVGLALLGRVGGVTVWRYIFDLSAELVAGEDAMAHAFQELAEADNRNVSGAVAT